MFDEEDYSLYSQVGALLKLLPAVYCLETFVELVLSIKYVVQ